MSERLEKFGAVCSRDEARQYFKDNGLTYDDIREGDILVLVMMMNQEVKKSVKANETSVNSVTLSKKVDMKLRTNGGLYHLYTYVNSHYFTRREAISFNPDGFIGFAGWADQGNTNPLLRAFLRWCDYLLDSKGEEHE